MALSKQQTVALKQIIKPGMRVCSLGYPDIIAPIEDMPGLEYRKDSEAICKRHGLQQRLIPDAHSLFKLLGCALDVYDVVRERGCEILCDLNFPSLWTKEYDIVLDVGTAEHCFNIGQALFNMARLVKKGGYIIHENPFCMGNHGFYSLNPTLFADFYAANGFTMLECLLISKSGQARPAYTKRFRFFGEEATVFCLAQRFEVKPFVFPVQSKYANLIPAAGASGEQKEVANA